MFSKFICGSLTALLLPVGMVMAQGHSGHGSAGHTSGHAGAAHSSGHPDGSWGGSTHGSGHPGTWGGSTHWSSHPGNWGASSHWSGRPGSWGTNRFGWNSGFNRWGWGGNKFARGNSWYWRGYPYRYRSFGYGYPFWGYGSAWIGGYPYGAYNWYPYSDYSNWYDPYADYSYSYPYDSGALYGPDYGPTTERYGGEPPVGDQYAPTFTENTSSRITITAPPEAALWVEGVKIASGGGAVHTFQTPPLNPDQQYRYQVRAVWTGSDGRTVDQTQEVVFSAGAGVVVRFPTAPAGGRGA
jgi:uncharacterized protein (TIGR03000 family)